MPARIAQCYRLAIVTALVACARPDVPNLLLVTFDTTRADHFGCMGDPEARTPTVDALAARGLLFERAYASVALTLPEHTTIMTGLEPPAHAVHDNGRFRVSQSLETLAERLQAAGFDTAASRTPRPASRSPARSIRSPAASRPLTARSTTGAPAGPGSLLRRDGSPGRQLAHGNGKRVPILPAVLRLVLLPDRRHRYAGAGHVRRRHRPARPGGPLQLAIRVPDGVYVGDAATCDTSASGSLRCRP